MCSLVGELCGCQVEPPSVVFRMRPYVPVAQPVSGCCGAKDTPYRWSLAPVKICFQFLPPLSLQRIVPSEPTITAFLLSRTKTPESVTSCGALNFSQLNPPS